LRRVLVALVLVAWGLGACGALLGIEQLPLLDERDGGDATSEALGPGDAADGGTCIDNIALGCQSCPHAFCDDFDREDGAVGLQWKSAFTPAGGPIFVERLDGGARASRVTDSVSPPYAYEAVVETDDNSSFLFIANQIAKHAPGPNFAGVRFRFQTRLRRLELTGVRGPIDSGAAIVAMMGPTDFTSAGLLFVVSSDGLYAVVGAGFLQEYPDASPYLMSSLAGFGAQAVFVEIFVTTRERALKEKLERCASVTAATVVSVRVNNLIHGCAPLEGALGDLTWTREPVIALGAGTFAAARVTFVHDNAVVDFLE
jgi:hypothetical protein